MQRALTGWGNYPVIEAKITRPERWSELKTLPRCFIARGMGRSYGDAALLQGDVVVTKRLNRILSFDEKRGLLEAESGLTIEEIITHFAPRGWFPFVTPGTRFVTIGGCVAADVHGKNHTQDGSFGRYVEQIELLLPDRSLCKCSASQNADLFWATIGGMGLTGLICRVKMKLRPIETLYMLSQQQRTHHLKETLELLSTDSPYRVAWVDSLASGKSLGRGVVTLARHAKREHLPPSLQPAPLQYIPSTALSIPPLPFPLINRWTVKIFNELFYRKKGREIETIPSLFFPLDQIGCWNHLYGKGGFIQYQAALPTDQALRGFTKILDHLREKSPCLAVLKAFGEPLPALLSFPIQGFTLALDMAISSPLFSLLDHLDQIVLEHGGRIYLAKDARMKADVFQAMYPRYSQFQQIKRGADPENLMRSELSKRLHLGGG